MADLHKAIRSIHNDVVYVQGETKKNIIAKDINEKEVSIDWSKVEAWKDPNEYVYNRIGEYPSIEDQLDKIYHDGIDKWKEEMIKPIKDKYPKE
jgi:hypothetical protein